MPRISGDDQRARRKTWAATAEPIVCDGCQQPFPPKHPRQRFCKGAGDPNCPGRRAPSGVKRTQPSGRQIAAARRVGVQGVLADVLLHVHHADLLGQREEIRAAIEGWIDAERGGRAVERHAALIRLQAACAVRTLIVAPPVEIQQLDDDPAG